MAIPKKRKKLEEAAVESVAGGEFVFESDQIASVPIHSTHIVDKAFEVVDTIERNLEKEIPQNKVKASSLKKSKPKVETRTETKVDSSTNTKLSWEDVGLHVHITLDTIDLDHLFNESQMPLRGTKSLMDVKFTVPYIWNLPLVGDVTKNMILGLKNFKIL